MKGNILIIEDEVKIARFLELELVYEGYKVIKCHDGKEGLNMAKDKDFDLILLDIMLPSMSGMEVLRRLREIKNTPVIMLTARDQTLDKVNGLDLGADDYVTKPFEIEELLARIRVILKRNLNNTKKENVLSIKDLVLDMDKYIVKFKNENIELTKKEFDLLEHLLKNRDNVLSRDVILEKVWGYDYYGDTNIVDVYIRYLRSKIDDKYNTKFIYTVRGVGYVIKSE